MDGGAGLWTAHPASSGGCQPLAQNPEVNMRPVLSPASRRLWRDQQTLQLGRAGPRAVVLAGLDPDVRAVLGLLDGTRDLDEIRTAAVDAGCPAARVDALLELLARAGLVADAAERWPERLVETERTRLVADVASLGMLHGGAGVAALRRRDRACVLVLGGGRVGAPLAGLLAAAGVGTVDVCDDGTARDRDTAVGGLRAADVGRRRGEAARERLRDVAPTTRTGPAHRADVVVLAPTATVDEEQVGALQRDGLPHLLVEVRDTVGVVGPLVLPGRSPCLRCLDLGRTDRDPDWPALAVQLAGPTRSSPACDGVLAASVSAQAALQVLALLDGGLPASLGGSLELALPDWRWRRRSWSVHPACECRWRAA